MTKSATKAVSKSESVEQKKKQVKEWMYWMTIWQMQLMYKYLALLHKHTKTDTDTVQKALKHVIT